MVEDIEGFRSRGTTAKLYSVLRSAARRSIGMVPATTSAASSDTVQKLLVMRSAQRL